MRATLTNKQSPSHLTHPPTSHPFLVPSALNLLEATLAEVQVLVLSLPCIQPECVGALESAVLLWIS